MNACRILGIAALLAACPADAWAHPLRFSGALRRVNHKLHGQVLDFTNNHGGDYRLYSAALCGKRDLYVYLPPCYDPAKKYPFMLWLHGFAQDESSFIRDVIEPLDRAIGCGQLPPMIIAAPDGSLHGWDCFFSAGSFYLNTKAGRYEDYLMGEVWDFVMTNFPVRAERGAHVIAGVSMGGGAAFNKAIKYRDRIATVLGIFPPVNLRWTDCHCNPMANFDPCCWGWRTNFDRAHEVVGRFYGFITIRQKQIVRPLFGWRNPATLSEVSRENPIEMIDTLNLKEGELGMYIAYGGKDQFNIDAEVESFLYRAKERGLTVHVGYDPNGKHDRRTAYRLLPDALDWLAKQLAPFAP